MSHFLPRVGSLLLLVCFTAGCALVGPAAKGSGGGTAAESAQKTPLGLSKQRMMLSEGYSKLYASATKLEMTDLVLYVKSSSADVDAIIADIAAFDAELKKDLERIASDYPGVRIDIDVQPEIEKRTRDALAKDLMRHFAPVVGRGGREYERTVLIGYTIAMEHERYLSRVMADEEPDAGLKKFLLATEKRYSSLIDRSMALLDKEYFRDPSGATREK